MSAEAVDVDARSEPTWEQLQVGLAVGPLTYTVTREMVAAFCEAMPVDREPYLPGGACADEIMPPTMLATDYVPLLRGHLALGWGLMARHAIKSLEPVKVGDTVTVTGTITEKFEKKGRHYWTLEYQVRNSRAELCLESTITCSVD